MQMNRRNFLAAFAATATLDPERLLRTRKKLISIPKPVTPIGPVSGMIAFNGKLFFLAKRSIWEMQKDGTYKNISWEFSPEVLA